VCESPSSGWGCQLTPGARACRLELSLALLEAAFELGHAQCELLTFTPAADGMAAREGVAGAAAQEQMQARAVAVTQARLAHHGSVSRPVSSEAAVWVQALALMLFGLLLSFLTGWNRA
jgi:hypothetical protein